jgi:hypothetical protein
MSASENQLPFNRVAFTEGRRGKKEIPASISYHLSYELT